EGGPATNDTYTVPDELLQQFLDIERLRAIADQGQQNDADRGLERAVLEELVKDNFLVRVPFESDVDTNLPRGASTVRQVGDTGDTLDPLIFDEMFELFPNTVAGFEIGNLSDDNDVTVLLGFEVGAGAKDDR